MAEHHAKKRTSLYGLDQKMNDPLILKKTVCERGLDFYYTGADRVVVIALLVRTLMTVIHTVHTVHSVCNDNVQLSKIKNRKSATYF